MPLDSVQRNATNRLKSADLACPATTLPSPDTADTVVWDGRSVVRYPTPWKLACPDAALASTRTAPPKIPNITRKPTLRADSDGFMLFSPEFSLLTFTRTDRDP